MWSPAAAFCLLATAAGARAAAADELRRLESGERPVPITGYRFEVAYSADAGRRPVAGAVRAEITPQQECMCKISCIRDPVCFGYAYGVGSRACQLLGQIPQEDSTEPDGAQAGWEMWRRSGYSAFGEPCLNNNDCRTFAPTATCEVGLCACGADRQPLADNQCARVSWQAVPVGRGRLGSDRRLGEPTTADGVEACDTRCKVSSLCSAYNFAAANAMCQLYSAGVAIAEADVGNDTSYILFQIGDAIRNPPSSFQEKDGKFYRTTEPMLFQELTLDCFSDDAILLPPEDAQQMQLMVDSGWFTSQYPTVGLDGLATPKLWIRTNGVWMDEDDPLWDSASNQPRAQPDEKIGCLKTANGLLHDCSGGHLSASVCRYVGQNLAPDTDGQAIEVPLGSSALLTTGGLQTGSGASGAVLTADLGTYHAVTSVLLHLDQLRAEDINVTVATTVTPGDGGLESLCTVVLEAYQYPDIARQYSCAQPLIGRFVRLQRAATGLRLVRLKVMGSTVVRL